MCWNPLTNSVKELFGWESSHQSNSNVTLLGILFSLSTLYVLRNLESTFVFCHWNISFHHSFTKIRMCILSAFVQWQKKIIRDFTDSGSKILSNQLVFITLNLIHCKLFIHTPWQGIPWEHYRATTWDSFLFLDNYNTPESLAFFK